jgi:hypothetical protein
MRADVCSQQFAINKIVLRVMSIIFSQLLNQTSSEKFHTEKYKLMKTENLRSLNIIYKQQFNMTLKASPQSIFSHSTEKSDDENIK